MSASVTGSVHPGQARGVTEQMAHLDLPFALGGELRPVPRDRGIEIDHPAIGEHERGERRHRLGRREVVDDGVAVPGQGAFLVDMSAPDVHDRLAVDEHCRGRADVGPGRKLFGQEIADIGEPWVAGSVDLNVGDGFGRNFNRLHDVLLFKRMCGYRARTSLVSNSLVTSTIFVRMLMCPSPSTTRSVAPGTIAAV
jgi:hypothetical protein